MTPYTDLPEGLRALLGRLKLHRNVKWEAPDYAEWDDGREDAPTLADAEAASSLLQPDAWTVYDENGAPEQQHALLMDIDVPAWFVPSSTEGHGHFYAQVRCHPDDLWEFLHAAVKIGLVEEGYVGACQARGATSLRLPWIRKGFEREPMPVRPAMSNAKPWLTPENDTVDTEF